MANLFKSPQIPINLVSDSEEQFKSSVDDNDSPIIPAEDSYFTDTPAPRPPALPNLRHLGIILNNKRRAAQRAAIRGVGAAWLDQDESGTYDPRKERATPPATPPPQRKKLSRMDEDDDESVVPRPQPRKSHRPVGYHSILIFKFTSKKALEYLRSISPGPFNAQSTTPDAGLSDSDTEGEVKDLFSSPLPRRKTRRSMRQRKTLQRYDGLTIDQLTLGHPQRRGCRACFEVGDDECSLIDKPNEYPCEACVDASVDCELIIPPKLKKSCERCKQKHIRCSYRINGGKGVDTCEECGEAKEKCVAAPLKSAAMHRKGTPDSSTPAPAALPRAYVSCNQCRNKSKRCSLKRGQPGPCSSCKRNGEECAFLPISLAASDTALSVTPPARELKRSRKKESKTASRPKRENQDPYLEHTPGNRNGRNENILAHEAWRYGAGKHRPSTLRRERERYDANATKKQKKRAEGQKRSSSSFSLDPALGISHGIPHIRIKTAFSHPIKFNYIPDPLGMSPCSWCDNPFFGLFGHGEKEIEVIPYPDVNGHGYEEMPKGHADNGKERSQMCVICTFKRIKIMACQKHEFEVIDVDPRLEIDGAIEESVQALLEGDEKGGELATNVAWCSVCPSAAVFRCSTRQADDLSPDVRTQGAESIGCGLYVCESCHDLTRKIVKDTHSAQETLDRTINIAAKDRFNYNYGVRADANFLTSSGELMARLQKGFGEIPFEEDEMEEVSEEFEGRR